MDESVGIANNAVGADGPTAAVAANGTGAPQRGTANASGVERAHASSDRRPSTVGEGRYFQMEFSPLRNPRSLSTISSSGLAKPRSAASDSTADPAAESAAAAYGIAAAAKVRRLEEHLNAYPIHSQGGAPTATVSAADGDDDVQAGRRGGPTVAQRGGLASTIGGVSSTSAPVISAGNKDALARRQKMDAWLSVADKGNLKLRSENEVLEKLALMAQENSLDNDAKYEEAITTICTQLEFAQTFRQDTSQAVQSMDARMEGIRSLISELVTTAERRCHQEHEAVHNAFKKQLEQQRTELDRVRERGKNTTHDWKTKNMTLQDQLEAVMHKTQSTYEKLSALQAESQRLRVEFSAQAGDADILQHEYRRVYTEHQRLKDQLYTLESDMAKATVRPSVSPASFGSNRPGSRSAAVASALEGELKGTSEQARGLSRQGHRPQMDNDHESSSYQRDRDYDIALRKVQIMFETEAANLKSVREAHLHTLRQRTELEVFLRQQIVKRKSDKTRSVGGGPLGSAKSKTPSAAARATALAKESVQGVASEEGSNSARVLCTIEGAPVAFVGEDRKEVVDQLLSTPRVLELLFGEAPSPQSKQDNWESCDNTPSASSPMRRVDSVAKPSVHEERELNALYETWKMWTERANREAFVAPTVPTKS